MALLLAGGPATAEKNPPAVVPLAASSLRVAGDSLRTRIVIDFDRKTEFSTRLLASPYRLVVDLPRTEFGFDEPEAARGLLSDIRYGTMGADRSRAVFTAIGPFKVALAKIMENGADGTFRLVIDLIATAETEFTALAESQRQDAPPAPAGPVTGAGASFTVAIDAGHGGIDTGARGRGGTLEKNITLAMARALAEALERGTNIRAVLIRDDDTFVSLSERVRRARAQSADLFVSLHADSIPVRGVRGATVYTFSERASNEMSRRFAERENRSDLIAGLSPEDGPDLVADILFDLTRQETQVFSDHVARAVIKSFDGAIRLINNPHRSAGFRVLRAPDVPSVLVELGYLSNRDDERLLTDPAWQAQTALLMVAAIDAYRQKIHGTGN